MRVQIYILNVDNRAINGYIYTRIKYFLFRALWNEKSCYLCNPNKENLNN